MGSGPSSLQQHSGTREFPWHSGSDDKNTRKTSAEQVVHVRRLSLQPQPQHSTAGVTLKVRMDLPSYTPPPSPPEDSIFNCWGWFSTRPKHHHEAAAAAAAAAEVFEVYIQPGRVCWAKNNVATDVLNPLHDRSARHRTGHRGGQRTSASLLSSASEEKRSSKMLHTHLFARSDVVLHSADFHCVSVAPAVGPALLLYFKGSKAEVSPIATDWLSELQAERDRCYLFNAQGSVCNDTSFEAMVHNALVQGFKFGAASSSSARIELHDFYYCSDDVEHDSRQIVATLYDVFCSSMGGAQHADGKDAARVFADFLAECHENAALRVFFLTFTPLATRTSTGELPHHAFERTVKLVLEAEQGAWSTIIGRQLLTLSSFPNAGKDAYCPMGSKEELDWLESRLLQSTLRADLAKLGLKLEKDLLAPGGFPLARALLMWLSHAHVEEALKCVSVLPSVILDRTTVHQLLLHPNLHSKEHFAELCDALMRKKLLNREQFEDLARAAFRGGGTLHVLRQFTEEVLFHKHGKAFVEGGSSTAEVEHPGAAATQEGALILKSYAPVLMELLSSAISPGLLAAAGALNTMRSAADAVQLRDEFTRGSNVKKLLEVALWLEQRGAPGVSGSHLGAMSTISTWIRSDITKADVKRDALGKLLLAADFPAYLADLLRGNAAELTDAQAAEPEFLMPDVLEEHWALRKRQDILNVAYGYLVLALEAPQKELLVSEMLCNKTAANVFFELMAPANSDYPRGVLRTRFVPLLQARHGMVEGFVAQALSAPWLFSTAEHFGTEVLDVLRMGDKELRSEFFTDLALAGIKLGDFRALSKRLRDVEPLLVSDDSKEQMLLMVSAVLNIRKREEFLGLLPLDGKDSLIAAADHAANAIAELDSGVGRDKLQSIIINTLNDPTKPPKDWPALMEGMSTIAMFIKYINRENLEKAYAAFRESNAESGKDSPASRLIDKVFAVYQEPIIKASDMSVDASNDSMDTLLDTLRAKFKPVGTGIGTVENDLGLLSLITAEWMDLKRGPDKKGVALAPRNVQSILYLAVAAWMRELNGTTTSTSRTLLGRMGTGEGKSLAFIMLAAHAVKIQRKNVHILSSNKALQQRDFADSKAIFKKLGITVSATLGVLKDDNDKVIAGKVPDVTFMLRSDFELYYEYEAFKGKAEVLLAKTLLLVDEVDSIVVGDENNLFTTRSKTDTDASLGLADAFKEVARLPSSFASTSKPPTLACSDDTWVYAKNARAVRERHTTGHNKGNIFKSDHNWFVNNESGAADGLSYPFIDYLNCVDFDTAVVRTDSFWYAQSLPYLFSRYYAIVGLSGSLGGATEKDYLSKTFGATILNVPYFLDTCTNAQKERPRLVDNGVYAFPSDEAQVEKIVAVAMEKSMNVPVVIITKSLSAKLATSLESRGGKERTNVFTPGAVKATAQDNRDKVKQATSRLASGAWAITVTDYMGGRGIDYSVTDRGVDKQGGLFVIITEIPEQGELEWVQWKGRTARSDRKGQYTVILSQTTEPLHSHMELLSANGMHSLPASPFLFASDAGPDSLATALLGVKDASKAALFDRLKDTAARGIRANTAVDAFYSAFPYPGDELPHSTECQWTIALRGLSDFIRLGGNFTEEYIAKFKAKFAGWRGSLGSGNADAGVGDRMTGGGGGGEQPESGGRGRGREREQQNGRGRSRTRSTSRRRVDFENKDEGI